MQQDKNASGFGPGHPGYERWAYDHSVRGVAKGNALFWAFAILSAVAVLAHFLEG